MKKRKPRESRKPWKQTERQKEIERMAREYIAAHPEASQQDVAKHIGIDPSRLSRLRKRRRIIVDIPAHAQWARQHPKTAGRTPQTATHPPFLPPPPVPPFL